MLCKHIMRVYNYNNIFILPPQYICNRWTKYAKKRYLSHEKNRSKQTLASRCAYLSRKMISVALKCSNSEKAVEYMENSFDKWASEIEDLLSQISLDDGEVPQCPLECTEDVTKTRVSFRVPTYLKGPMTKRKKNVLERENKRPNKNTRKRGKATNCI